MLKYVIRLGNNAVHTNKRITRADAILSLKNLFEFCDWIDYSYRAQLADQLHSAVMELNYDSFLVKRHLRYVKAYSDRLKWNRLETTEIGEIKEHLAPIVKPSQSDELARRFDHLMYSIICCSIWIRKREKFIIPNLMIRSLDVKEGEPLSVTDQFENYRKKVEYYLKSNENTMSVYKLRNNKSLNKADLAELERILWTELGSKEDYRKEYGETPIGRLVRKIVGVDREAVNEAFSQFLTDEKLNINQIRFVKLIVDYIVANGNIEDNSDD